MRTFSAIIVGTVAVVQVAAQYTVQSPPFNLILLSTNATINGSPLYPCHEGAAIEALCPSIGEVLTVGNKSVPNFNFNYTASSPNDTSPSTPDSSGTISWNLRSGNQLFPSGLRIQYNPTSNIAVPLFYPGDQLSTYMAFDECGKLNILGYIDDTTDPPTTGNSTAYYRWYICTTEPTWYVYKTLAWVMGKGKPENPTCEPVQVKRLFI